jgi:hypothetical protein
LSKDWPATTAKPDRATSMFAANALPLALRHMPQWQTYIVRGASRTS